MKTKAGVMEGLNRQGLNYLARIEESLREIKTVQKQIAARRVAGRKVSGSIRRQHEEIQTVLNRVEAAL
jgi:hypothetical protein